MTHTCIPQSNSITPVLIKASHWQKYIGDLASNYILTGLAISAGSGLSVNVASGRAYIGGIEIESDATDSNQLSLTPNTTNYIYAQLTRDGSNEPSGWTFTFNTTGVAPADSVLLGYAITTGSAVSGVNVTTTQQGLLLKNFAVSQISVPVGGSLSIGAFTNTGDQTLGANNLKTTTYIFSESATGVRAQLTTSGNNSPIVEIFPSGVNTTSVIRLYSLGSGAVANVERFELISQAGNYVINSATGGTGTLRPIQLQMNSNSVITINTDNSVNANSRTWSNLIASSPTLNGSIQLGTDAQILATNGTSSTNYDAMNIRKAGGRSASNPDFIFRHESTNTQFLIYSYDGTTAKNYLEFDHTNAVINAIQNVSIGSNKIKTSNYQIWEDTAWLGVGAYVVEKQTNANIFHVIRTSSAFAASYNAHLGDNTNYSRFIAGSLSGNAFGINAIYAGTAVAAAFKIQFNSNDILTINTDNSVNWNSRAQSNVVLGSTMNFNANSAYGISGLKFGSDSGDVIGNTIVGNRTADLAILSASDGSTARKVLLQTQSVTTAGSGNATNRLTITGGAVQGSALITSYEPFDFEAYLDIKVISIPANPAAGYGRFFMYAVDGSNDRLYGLVKVAGSVQNARVLMGNEFSGLNNTALWASNDASKSINSAAYLKAKEITVQKGGKFYVRFDLKSSNSTAVYGQIYRNGVAVGTERTTSSTSYQTYGEYLDGWSPSDAVQLYVKGASDPLATIANFRIYTEGVESYTNTLT